MVADIDICRSAQLMIDQHGDSASTEASKKADEMLAKNDVAGWQAWQRIVLAIAALQLREAPGVTH